MSLSEIKEFVRDKNVLLVGNNLTALEKEQGELIDSYDIVVRFGKGIPNGHEKYLGSKTDIWVTGGFRKTMRKYLPNTTKVLYNTSTMGKPVEPPDYEHTVMYSQESIDNLNKNYGQVGKKRLSAGAITAYWFFNEIKDYKTLSFVNFDFFHSTTKFLDTKHGIHNVASSWHLPLTLPSFAAMSPPADVHPAHDLEVEKRLFSAILEDSKSIFIGELPQTAKFVEVDNAAWDDVRQKIED